MRKLALGLVVALAAASGVHARTLKESDILGRWCSPDANYVFTHNALTVTWPNRSDRRVLNIKSFEIGNGMIVVNWTEKSWNRTVYRSFSDDGYTMVQEQADNKAHSGPERIFHRCK